MSRKKTPSQQRAADLYAALQTSQPPLEPPEDGGNVPWRIPLSLLPDPRYDPDQGPVGYVAYAGRTFESLIEEIQALQMVKRDLSRELRNLREQLAQLGEIADAL